MLLLTNYREVGHFIKFPCVVQEKLDGVRCLIRNGKGISRSGKEINNITHILDEIKGLDCIYQLDGELWCEDMSLHEICSLLNRKRLERREERRVLKIKLHVFDIKMIGAYRERMLHLQHICDTHSFEHTKFVTNHICEDEETALDLANKWIDAGKEGAVFRNLVGLYVNGRTPHVQKYKARLEGEFVITGFQISEENHLIWRCATDTEHKITFNVRNTVATGISDDDPNVADKIGEQMTLQYMSLDPVSGIPREAVCKGIKIKN